VSKQNTVVLDNEAVQALADPRHRKHQRMLGFLQGISRRNVRRKTHVRVVVPTSVRVEAGWDRTHPRAAAITRLHIGDASLDAESANRAAHIRTALGVSVADAHLGAVLQTTPGPHAALTSDADDLRRVSDHLNIAVQIVTV
jgi:hypothetical protein